MSRPLALHDTTASTSARTGPSLTLAVQGMHCAACAASIERELRTLPYVAHSAVNFALARATVQLASDDEQPLALQRVLAAISRLGFHAEFAPGFENTDASQTSDASLAALANTRNHAQPNLWAQPVLACLLSLPVVLIAMSHGRIALLDAPWTMLVQVLLTACVIVFCGWRLLLRGARSLVQRRPTMESLITLGTFASVAASCIALVRTLATSGIAHAHHAPVYFEAACVMLSFVLLGKAIEAHALRSLTAGFAHLRKLLPRTLLVVPRDLRDATTDTSSAGYAPSTDLASRAVPTPASLVVQGDVVLVRAHERVPVDGTIVQGESELDTSALTGETRPLHVREGDSVQSGSMNLSGPLLVQATRAPSASTLAVIVDVAERAHTSKAPIARMADAIAAWFVPLVVVLAIGTALVWLVIGSREQALQHMLCVLLIACPCALGLATPTALLAHLSTAARKGLVFRDASSLEALARIKRLVLDKTGTLTQGTPRVLAVHDLVAQTVLPAQSNEPTSAIAPREQELARIVLALQGGNTHPLAKGLQAWARSRLGVEALPLAKRVKVIPGKGTEGLVNSEIVQMGSLAWLAPDDAARESILTARVANAIAPAQLEPHPHVHPQALIDAPTTVLLCVARKPIVLFLLRDELREDAPAAIASLGQLRITPVLATGDALAPALRVAHQLGITNVHAEQSPQDKLALVQESADSTAMLGDGINDAPALAGARVGIAIAHDGNDFAQAAAGLVVLAQPSGASLSRVIQAIQIARRTMRTIKRNLACAFGYNILALPLAMGAFEPVLGWSLSPMIASALMALSSISVVLSSLLSAERQTEH